MLQSDLVQYTFDKNNIHIKDSYEVTHPVIMRNCLIMIRQKARKEGIRYNRTMNSWIQEWKAHNLLYMLDFKKDRTGSVDINEDEPKYIQLGYFILAMIYDIYQKFS